jgi:hypothetical protein
MAVTAHRDIGTNLTLRLPHPHLLWIPAEDSDAQLLELPGQQALVHALVDFLSYWDFILLGLESYIGQSGVGYCDADTNTYAMQGLRAVM